MKVIVDLCVVPIGVGVHVVQCVAACEKVLSEAELRIQERERASGVVVIAAGRGRHR